MKLTFTQDPKSQRREKGMRDDKKELRSKKKVCKKNITTAQLSLDNMNTH